MSILDRSALEGSPLADLHAIASELSIDGYRRLRKAQLIDAILARQGVAVEPKSDRSAERPTAKEGAKGKDREPLVEGVVELLSNGSGFLRVNPPEPHDDDVYISAAQVRRCDLVSGDRISGPRRAPRRSERFASLVRVETINGRPAAEVADSTRFDDLPAAFPSERFRLGSDDPTVKAIEWLTPIGRGSRVTVVGPPGSGKSEALRRLTSAICGQEELTVLVVIAGVRPEEVGEWSSTGAGEPAAVALLGSSPELQAQTIERGVDQARRLAARGTNVVMLIDSLEALSPHAARKLLAAARDIVDGGSLTIAAAAPAPVGGETTVIALDPALASTGRLPALDLAASWTLRPELLVGDAGAAAIARARLEAMER